jgi:hypothetical protein
MSCNEFYELPPKDEDRNKKLDEQVGFDSLGNEHIYYVYYKPTIHGYEETIMSIGDDNFVTIWPKDSDVDKASKQFFIDARDRYDSFNRMYSRNIPLAVGELEEDPIEEFSNNNNNNLKHRAPKPPKTSKQKYDAFLEEKMTLFSSEIEKRSSLFNRLELYKLIERLKWAYDNNGDISMITELSMQTEILKNKLKEEDMKTYEKERLARLQHVQECAKKTENGGPSPKRPFGGVGGGKKQKTKTCKKTKKNKNKMSKKIH